MFVSENSLPHVLEPACYYDAGYFARERELLREGWHVIGSTSDLKHSGDYLTADILGIPLHVRNFDGTIKALSNVCAHRHCLISSRLHGNSQRMQCQYHGWEYHADGRTGKIPEPKNFMPLDREAIRLPTFALEIVGQLIFACVSPSPKPIRDFLGSDFHELLCQRFDGKWLEALKWQPEYPVNWKIPVENSLEAYHVPAIHPQTFGDDPGSERSEHILLPHRTAFGTRLPFAVHSRMQAFFQRWEGRFVAWMGHPVRDEYWQHHVFPNLLFSFTDAISLCNCIIPTGPTSCRAVVRQFGRLPARSGFLKRFLAILWSRLEASIIKRILYEDLGIFSAIQRGLQASSHRGILGRCEERIHAMHVFMRDRVPQTQLAEPDISLKGTLDD